MLFSGGRGSGALTSALVATPGVNLTIAINGYDDGASTGEVRRFLGDALGPSDFRKNASRVAAELRTCPPALIAALDRRLPDGSDSSTVATLAASLQKDEGSDSASGVGREAAATVGGALGAFLRELSSSGRAFRFDDCSIGNLVFAGLYLQSERRFNQAVDVYAALVGLPPGLIENVTDGTNAFLVAIDADGRVLGSEADIVDATQRNTISDIVLIDHPLGPAESGALSRLWPGEAAARLSARSVVPGLNDRLATAVGDADMIIYAPGTQHSSLFPSYLTPGLSNAIAANLKAIKLLITNIQADAEIAGSSAVDIIGRAVYYLKEKERLSTPTPALITHYLLNDPAGTTASDAYVPLGRLDTLQDPRLVRVGHWEEGVTGRHDALKVLGPFLSRALEREQERRRIAVVLYDAISTDKIAQTLVEMVRGGLANLPFDVTVFCEIGGPLDRGFVATMPFGVRTATPPLNGAGDPQLRQALRDGGFEYVVLFESSGMYNGEDVPWLVSHLTGRLDAVWGSRRLSVRDIEESIRLKYRHRALLGAASAVGSHVLSLMYLALYGRYVSDTLSGARAVRVDDACSISLPLTHRRANQQMLSRLLSRKAEMFEVPVHFYSVSPEQVKRTTVFDGLRSMATIVASRLKRSSTTVPAQASGSQRPSPSPTTR